MQVAPANRRWTLACFCLLFFASGALAQVPVPQSGTSRPRTEPGEPSTLATNVPVFEFHSSFWMNLHHFLYQQARSQEELPVRRAGDQNHFTSDAAQNASPEGGTAMPPLTPPEAAAWQASVDHYRAVFAGRDLLFSTDMVLIKNRLAELQNAPDLQLSGFRPELIAALEGAAPIYRKHWWPEHDRQNRRWVEQVTPLVEKFGPALARKLSAVYQAAWPAGRIWVDVTIYAGRAGGYTSVDPLHVTISSAEPRNQGTAALEVLFHEASHGIAGRIREMIEQRCRTLGKPIPRDLWHAILFFTTGEMVRRSLLEAGDEVYWPYAFRHGLYARGWENYLRLIERYWKPYLDGQSDFDRALVRLVNAL
jgi:hypothetical protein